LTLDTNFDSVWNYNRTFSSPFVICLKEQTNRSSSNNTHFGNFVWLVKVQNKLST